MSNHIKKSSNESTSISNNAHKAFEYPPMRKTSTGEGQISTIHSHKGLVGEEGV
jgi:hypothetical protein